MAILYSRFPMLTLALFAMTALVVHQGLPLTADPLPFDPKTGYRVSKLRDPVPNQLDGGEVLNVDQLEALLATGRPLLIDVFDDRPGRLQQWNIGFLRRSETRMNIAGSITMAGFGDGALGDKEVRAFNRQLDLATGGDNTRSIVFYCLANCWTSWNAARRAVSLGYRNVKWFRDGVETWSDAGLPMAPVAHNTPGSPNADLVVSSLRH
jgi:PQQ-dependent catabolism-associated CXXCW motif protein